MNLAAHKEAQVRGAFDEEALERLFVELERPLYNVVFRWLWNADDADDVVQETFLRLWGMRERVIVDTVRALAFRIAVNLASSRRRRKKLWQWVGVDVEDGALHSAPVSEGVLEDRRVRDAVEKLPERLRAVVVMTELSGLSYAEVAGVLGVPVGTVASRRNHALLALRKSLGGADEKSV